MIQLIASEDIDSQKKSLCLQYIAQLDKSILTCEILLQFVDYIKKGILKHFMTELRLHIFKSFSWEIILKSIDMCQYPQIILEIVLSKALMQNSLIMFSAVTTEVIVLENNQRISCKVNNETFSKIQQIWPKVMTRHFNNDYIKCLQSLTGQNQAPYPPANVEIISASVQTRPPTQNPLNKSECRLL